MAQKKMEEFVLRQNWPKAHLAADDYEEHKL
jgi:hypothetical protein